MARCYGGNYLSRFSWLFFVKSDKLQDASTKIFLKVFHGGRLLAAYGFILVWISLTVLRCRFWTWQKKKANFYSLCCPTPQSSPHPTPHRLTHTVTHRAEMSVCRSISLPSRRICNQSEVRWPWLSISKKMGNSRLLCVISNFFFRISPVCLEPYQHQQQKLPSSASFKHGLNNFSYLTELE